MSKIINNIQDINVPSKPTRTLTVQITFKPDESRTKIVTETIVKSKTVPTAPISTMLIAGPDENGEVVYREATLQTPGQMDIFDGVQPEPPILKVIKNA